MIFKPRYLPVFLWKEMMRREEKDVFCELLRVLVKRQNHDEDIINPRTSAEIEFTKIMFYIWNPLQYSAACSVLKSFPVKLGRRIILR